MGSGYVVEHCVAALSAKRERELYETYVADSLFYIAQGHGVTLNRRLYEIRHPAPVDDRPTEEIVNERLAKMGITVVSS